ncbi:MAG: serpin family protein [Elusimicrobiales bacterium]
MKNREIILLALTACLAAPLCAKEKAPQPSPAERANAIAFKFYAKEAVKPGNLFFSPYSMYTAFAMAYEGAKTRTAAEIASVFAFPAAAGDLRDGLDALDKDLKAATKEAEFRQANSFWAQRDYKFRPEYLKILRSRYGAEARQVDFKTGAEEARAEINAWTEEQTKGRIKGLFPARSLDPLSRLVLVNAVYFKGKWEKTFRKEQTFDGEFTRGDGSTVTVKMMSAPQPTERFYYEEEDLQALRMPYRGGLSMLVLLPRKGGKGLPGLEKTLSAQRLADIRAGLAEQKAKVFFPRFTFSSGFGLNDALADLGMPTVFTDAADLSGMDGTKNLYIQKAFHKAFVEVNEEGTEAAAATGIAVGTKSMAIFDIPVFRADRPFLFFIEDPKSGLLLFMGRVEDPAKE